MHPHLSRSRPLSLASPRDRKISNFSCLGLEAAIGVYTWIHVGLIRDKVVTLFFSFLFTLSLSCLKLHICYKLQTTSSPLVFEGICEAYPPDVPPSMAGRSVCRPPPLKMRLTDDTEGKLCGSQAPCRASCSRISQANIVGCSCFIRRIFLTTVGVATC